MKKYLQSDCVNWKNKITNKLNLLTLCSGIGSPEIGAMRVYDSVNIVAACEIDKFARQTYKANFKINPKHYHRDVTKMDATPYKGLVDGLVGGFPCQAFSVAGKQLGFEDTRGTIFFDCVRILKEVQPKFFIFENVKGLVGHDKEKDSVEEVCTLDLFGGKSTQKIITKGRKYWSSRHPKKEIGRTLHTMERVLSETGYFWSWAILNTKDFGVPQNRERIFMVGFKNEEDFNNFSFPRPFPLVRRLKDILEDDVDERYYLKEKNLRGLTLHNPKKSDIKTVGHSGTGQQRGDIVMTDGVSSCLTACDYKQPKQIMIACILDKNNSGISLEQNRRVLSEDGISSTLTTMQESRVSGEETKQHLEINFSGASNCLTLLQKSRGILLQKSRGFNKGGVKAIDGVCPTLGCSSWQENNHLVDGFRIRKLTPLECFRLQDFPDSFIKVVSNSQLYKQAGNSMSVNVMEEIFRQVKSAMCGEETRENEFGGLFGGGVA